MPKGACRPNGFPRNQSPAIWGYCWGPQCLRELVKRTAPALLSSQQYPTYCWGTSQLPDLVDRTAPFKDNQIQNSIKFPAGEHGLTRRAPRGRRIIKVCSNTPSSKGSADTRICSNTPSSKGSPHTSVCYNTPSSKGSADIHLHGMSGSADTSICYNTPSSKGSADVRLHDLS